MSEGVDYAWARPDPAGLYRAGKRFACRYISNSTSVEGGHSKNIDAHERDRLWAAGLAVVINWEWAAGDAKGGYAKGRSNATAALAKANALGLPANRPIYFSVDFDPAGQLGVISEYFRGIASVLPKSRIGVYGGYSTVEHLHKSGAATWLWQTYGWSGGRWYPGVHIQQYRNGVQLLGADCDLNRAMVTDYGQWAPTTLEADTMDAKQEAKLDKILELCGYSDGRWEAAAAGTDIVRKDLTGGGHPVWLVKQTKAQSAMLTQALGLLTGLAGKDMVDEAAIVAGVLAGLTPEAIAAAIPPAIAQGVVDALAVRLQQPAEPS